MKSRNCRLSGEGPYHARRCEQIAALPLPRLAAREAYYAAFHAAEAYIFEHTGKVATTHRGVRSEFARLARREPRIDRELTRFLATAYQLKAAADYGIGPTVAPISADQAAAAITTAGRFIDTITQLLPPGLDPATRPGRATLTARPAALVDFSDRWIIVTVYKIVPRRYEHLSDRLKETRRGPDRARRGAGLAPPFHRAQ